MRKIVGVRLDDVRREKGYTSVKQLSAACGIPWRTLEQWEAGRLDRAVYYKLFYLAEFLEVDVHDLFIYEGE